MNKCRGIVDAAISLHEMGCPVSMRSILAGSIIRRIELTRPLKGNEIMTIEHHHDGSISVNFTLTA